MDVLLLRHARAEERELFALSGNEDALRPLTRAGAKRMRGAVRGLRRLLPHIDVIASSPLLRAVQTAEIVADGYGGKAVQVPQLAPGHAPSALLPWLRSQGDAGVVVLVGHEPDLGALASWLLAGGERSFVPLKKGAGCLLRLAGGIKSRNGELLWAMTARQMRAMRR